MPLPACAGGVLLSPLEAIMRDGERGLRSPPGALRALRVLVADESAPTSIEYALMLAGVALAIIVAVGALGARTEGLFSSVAAAWP